MENQPTAHEKREAALTDRFDQFHATRAKYVGVVALFLFLAALGMILDYQDVIEGLR